MWPLQFLANRRVGTTRASSGATSLGLVTVTASATIHTKGSWVELVAATDGPGQLVVVQAFGTATSAAATSMLLDIGIGAAGSEVVLIPDLGVGYTTGSAATPGRKWHFPVFVPSGVRLAARCQALIASDTVDVIIDVYGGGAFDSQQCFSAVTAYGANAATSRGVSVANGGTANVKGSWVQITAATTEDIAAIAIATQGAGSVTLSARSHLIDIGIGAAASEVVLAEDLFYVDNATEFQYQIEPWPFVPFATPIPSGARIAARRQCSAASDTTCDLIVYGMR